MLANPFHGLRLHRLRLAHCLSRVSGSEIEAAAAAAAAAAPMPSSPEQVVSEVGKRLAEPRLGKDALVKLLKVTSPFVAESLPDLNQPASI